MKSEFNVVGDIELPFVNGEYSMLPFEMSTMSGLSGVFKDVAEQLIAPISAKVGIAYLTLHGRFITKGNTLRRPFPHTDGNYEPHLMTFGGTNGWKVGENGAAIDTDLHCRQYNSTTGGIILATNYASCLGWKGIYDGLPSVGGDCRHIELDEPSLLREGKIYYGNNHFIHESLPVQHDIHRVFARVTLPENHRYEL